MWDANENENNICPGKLKENLNILKMNMAVWSSGWKFSSGSNNKVKFYSIIKFRIKIKVLTAVTSCVTSVTVT